METSPSPAPTGFGRTAFLSDDRPQQTALSRRAKRRVYGPPHTAYVDSAGGAKDAVREEIHELLADPIVPSTRDAELDAPRGMVVLRDADYRRLLEICLRAQTVSDLRMIVHQEAAERVSDLKAALARAPFDLFIPPGRSPALVVDSTASTVYHEGLIRDACREILDAKGFGVDEPGSAETESRFKVVLSILHDTLRVSISLAGEPLWKRGYRVAAGAAAPLREDLAGVAVRLSFPRSNAAGAARAAGAADAPEAAGAAAPGERVEVSAGVSPSYREQPQQARPFIFVPFAGTGTLAFEAAIFAFRMSARFFGRRFAFEEFPFGVPPSVGYAVEQVRDRVRRTNDAYGALEAVLLDNDAGVLEQAQANLGAFRQGLADSDCPQVLDCTIRQADVFSAPWTDMVPHGGSVYLPLNPPYGLRLAATNLEDLYRRIGAEIWGLSSVCRVSGCCLCPSLETWRIVRDAASNLEVRTVHVGHGGLDIRLLCFGPRV